MVKVCPSLNGFASRVYLRSLVRKLPLSLREKCVKRISKEDPLKPFGLNELVILLEKTLKIFSHPWCNTFSPKLNPPGISQPTEVECAGLVPPRISLLAVTTRIPPLMSLSVFPSFQCLSVSSVPSPLISPPRSSSYLVCAEPSKIVSGPAEPVVPRCLSNAQSSSGSLESPSPSPMRQPACGQASLSSGPGQFAPSA